MENFNLVDNIRQSLNELFSGLFSSIDNNIYSLLDNLIFINSKITNEPAIKNIFGDNITDGILLICNSLVFGFIIYYAANFLFSHLTYSKVQSPSQFIFKSIIFIGLMNSSLWICSQIIDIVSILTELIKNLGKITFGYEISFANLINKINSSVYINNSEFSMFSFDGMIKSFTSFGLINLLFTYSLRYIMLQVFILISPFAFLCLITDSTSWFFSSWLRSFISMLCVQVLISIILTLSFSLNFNSETNLSKLLLIGTIYALLKANLFMQQIIGGISTDVSIGINNLKQGGSL
ncbi:MAG: hypothetical protein IKM97_02055 [Clostridia bacterium]|nr:hypothetical protein [Clostridia bacterium]